MQKSIEIEKEALKLIQDEKNAYEHCSTWISNSASFNKQEEIDNARKNYYGQFDEPEDQDTKKEKLWVPMTEWTVERMVSDVDLDTRNINLMVPYGKSSQSALTFKLILANFLKRMFFGDTLNDFIRKLSIDGTGIVKYFNKYNPEYKRNMPTLRIVDPLNIIMDPSVRSIHETAVIERSIMTKSEIERYDWGNKNLINYSEGAPPLAKIYERWGEIPKDWITQNPSDIDKWVDGVIIASAFKSENGKDEIALIHKIDYNQNPLKLKPYEECWLRRVPNRFWGRGIPEQLRHLQEWLNTVVNIRRDELMNKLAGKYKIRKGSGITKQMIQSLKAGGGITVDELDDIAELSEKDVQVSAYREPAEVWEMAQRVTGATDVPSQPGMEPTTAVIQARTARSVTGLVQENIGLFLERLFKRGVIPLIVKDLKEGEILKITGETEDLRIIRDTYINSELNKEISKYFKKNGRRPRVDEMVNLRRRMESKFKEDNKEIPLKVRKKVFDTNYEVDVQVTGERFEPSIVLKQLNDFLFSYARLPQADIGVIDSVVREYMNVLNVPLARTMPQRQGTVPQQVPPEQRQPAKPTREQPEQQIQRSALEGLAAAGAR